MLLRYNFRAESKIDVVLCAVGVVLQNGSLATEDISTNAEDLMSGQADQYRSDEIYAKR